MYLLNRCPTRALANQISFEAWSGRKPSVNHLKIFGCVCYAQIPKEKRQKLDETSEKCIFIGYSSISKGYKLYILKKNKTLMSRDVILMRMQIGIGKNKKLRKVLLSRCWFQKIQQVKKKIMKKKMKKINQIHQLTSFKLKYIISKFNIKKNEEFEWCIWKMQFLHSWTKKFWGSN